MLSKVENMKLSVVTISFNQKRFLRECIDSVLSQRDELKGKGIELEYIVVDPGSDDGSRELIESFGNEIISIFENDNGPSDGLNNGFSRATGDILGYINADDYFLPGALAKVIHVFKNNDCDLFYGHGWIVDEDSQILHRCLSHKFSLKQYALGNVAVMQQSTFFKRKVYEASNKFNDKNKVSWDGELLVDIALSGAKCIRINEFLSCFRVYNNSISGSGKYLHECRVEHIRIAKKINERCKYRFNNFYKIQKLVTRISDPYYLVYRLLDQIQYGKRVIPS